MVTVWLLNGFFTLCIFGVFSLYYGVKQKYQKEEQILDTVIPKYVELMREYNELRKELDTMTDKYRYKLSLVALLQDKFSELKTAHITLEKKYNLLEKAYNENKEDLTYAKAILSGTPEENE